MKKPNILLIAAFCFIAIVSHAQKATIKGTVTDTLNKQTLHNAVISLLRSKDSVLYKFTRTNEKGNFELTNLSAGKYVIMITYPNYAEFMDDVTLTDTSTLHLYQLALITKAKLLEEVIVRQKVSPIKFKGDTLEIIADSFKLRAGASVEDLLKRIPGFTVNSKGEITAQGQTVQKVLVDGDEFFGDDPTMATQNLNAKDVAKVQLFDRKSDQATLTGIDDGQKQKTINLVLKDDAKKGYFGKVEAGSDFDQYYQAKATANKFTSLSKAGIYISADRTGNNNMTWNEQQDFNSNITTTVMDNGGVAIYSQGDGFNNYNLQGIPENLQTSAMFNQKFGLLKNNTVNNYTFKNQNTVGQSTTNTTYILPDTVYYNNNTNHFNSSKWQQTLSTKNELNIDSFNTFNINAKGSWGYNSQNNNFTSDYLSSNLEKVNSSLRNTTSTSTNNNQKSDLFYRRKLNKAGTRIFTVSGSYLNTNSNSSGFLYTETDFYSGGIINSTQIVDQKKTTTNSATLYGAIASYTEPLTKKISLNVNYSFNTENSDQNISSYEKVNGIYDSLNPLYSNHFNFINTSNKCGFTTTYNGKKLYTQIGLTLQDISLNEKNLYNDSTLHRSFTNFFPRANIRWKYSAAGQISLSYNGYSNQPSLNQIQPIANNTDPLNIVTGNPDLKPSFSHNFNLYFGNSKTITGRDIWVYSSLNLTENAFASKSTIDTLGRRVSQTVNVNGNYNYYLSTSYRHKIKFLSLELSLGPAINGGRNISFVNNIQNITLNYNAGFNFGFNRFIEKKLDFYLNYNPGFNHSVSSVNTAAATNYWVHSINNFFTYRLIKGWNLISNIRANFRQKINPTDINTNSVVWDASVERKLFKKKDWYAIFSVNDILNQNIGFNRNVTSNFITENTYNTVQRYFLFSLRWRFAKNRKTDEDF